MIVTLLNDFFSSILEAIPLRPTHYFFVFPPNLSLQQVEALYDDGTFGKLSGLAPSISYAILLSLVRFVLQNYVIKPLAIWCMQLKMKNFTPSAIIDKHLPYSSKAQYTESQLEAVGQSLSIPTLKLENYLLDRHVTNTNSKKIVKFVEAFWRAFFYAAFCILGYFSLFSPDTVLWITDPSQNWRNWPFHKITPAILFYYQIELGCYFHQLMWTDRNHSDALEMMIHHIVTISLIIISHLANFFRVGAIILLIHDISDVFLETAKVLNYTAKPASHNWLKVVVDIVFAIFAVLFFITRLVIYPGFVLTSMFTDGYQEFGISWLGAYVYVGLLLALQALHIFWFYLISRMIYKLVFDKIEKDERSDDESEDVIILKSDGKKTN